MILPSLEKTWNVGQHRYLCSGASLYPCHPVPCTASCTVKHSSPVVPLVGSLACRADSYLLAHALILYSSVQFTQSTHASVDSWMDLVRGLPEDPPLETLMSHSALKATIIRIYDLRMSDLMKSPNPQELVSRDSVFDSIANYFNQQFAGDGEEVYMPELMEINGPVARLLMSCRCATVEALVPPHCDRRLRTMIPPPVIDFACSWVPLICRFSPSVLRYPFILFRL